MHSGMMSAATAIIGTGHRAMTVPTLRHTGLARFFARLDPADLAPDGQQRRTEGQCREDGDDHRHRTGRTEGAEVVQMRQAQAQRGARDRNTRPQDDVRHVGDGLVVGRFLVFAVLTGFLVSTEVKNRIVRRGTQNQGHQQVGRE